MKKFLFVAILFVMQLIVAQTVSTVISSTDSVVKGSGIVVQVNGIKHPSGQVLLTLFNSEEGFPTQPEKGFMWGRAKVTSSSLIISLDGLPPGKYAIAVVHDENENEVMDTNFLGLPAEPYGISNNVTGTFSPPTFEEAKFSVTGKRDTVKIEMQP